MSILPQFWLKRSDRIEVPLPWNDQINLGKPIPRYGFGTYSLRVLLPEDHPEISLRFLGTFSAYKMFINGEEALQSGIIGKDRNSTQPFDLPESWTCPASAKELFIVVQWANFHMLRGGMLHNPILGTNSFIGKIKERQLMLGGALFWGSYNFLPYLYRFLFFPIRREIYPFCSFV